MVSTIKNNNVDLFWKKINDEVYTFTDIAELFLTRFAAFQYIASGDVERREKAKRFLLRTMTQSEQEYDFPQKEQFVSSIIQWDLPEIAVTRCDEQLAAIVYKISYKTAAAEKLLYDIAFFNKGSEGAYQYSHKFDLQELYARFCASTATDAEIKIRQIGDAVLHNEAESVTDFGDKKIAEQLQILKTALTATGGVGIAANQCGQIDKPLKIILSGIDYTNPEHVVKAITRYPTTLFPPMRVCINPEIVKLDSENVAFNEGCLSAQGGFRGSVLRPKTMLVRYQDEKGRSHEVTFSGSDARVMLHELDHILNGKVYIQRIFSELSLEQCHKLNEIISEVLASDRKKINASLFIVPEVIFERNDEGEITYDAEKVRNIFSSTKDVVLHGLKESLQQRIVNFSMQPK